MDPKRQHQFRVALGETIKMMDMRDVEEAAIAMIEMSRMIGGIISWQVTSNPLAQKLLIQTCKDAIEEGVKVGVVIIHGTREQEVRH